MYADPVAAPELINPPELAADTLRSIPLGGLGDIGRNMTALEINGQLLLIDCGVLFPEDHHPGVDLILPSFDVIADRLDDVVGLVLTHGHEDHIGAVPYLLRERPDIPLFGSRLTLALVAEKVKEHRISGTQPRPVAEGDRVSVGQFDCEFIAVNHSIPDGLAVFVRTVAGTLLHTGDFKMDQLPLDRRLTDLRAFSRIGVEGVDLLMSDSTNAEVPGFTTHEKDILPALERVFATTSKRLIVTSFASHVHRVQQVLDTAARFGRKVAYVGRSMIRNMNVARDLGYLHVPENTMIDVRDIDDHPPDKVVLISTGSQGEPLSALSRIANREHPHIALDPGDTVVLASSLVPGNENAVFRVINGLTKLGARVIHRGNALVHVSGHASAGELLYVYNVVRPGNVVPVHGEVRHLTANAGLAVSTGVPSERALVADDGAVIDLRDGVATVVGQVECDYIFVDGSTVGDVNESALTDRRILGEEGFISVVAVVNTHRMDVINGPDIHARGFHEDEGVFDSVRSEVAHALGNALNDGVTDTYRLQQLIRRHIGKWVSDTYRRRPMIIPVVVAV